MALLKKHSLLCLFLAFPLYGQIGSHFADRTLGQVGFLYSDSLYTSIQQDVQAQQEILSDLRFHWGIRAMQRTWAFERVDLKADLVYQPLSFISLFALGRTTYFLAPTSTLSSVGLGGGLEGPSSWVIRPFLRGGLFFRSYALTLNIPLFFSATTEKYGLTTIGLELALSPTLNFVAEVGTFDDFSIFAINSPFAQIRAFFPAVGYQWVTTARYRLALGFGRMNDFLISVGTYF